VEDKKLKTCISQVNISVHVLLLCFITIVILFLRFNHYSLIYLFVNNMYSLTNFNSTNIQFMTIKSISKLFCHTCHNNHQLQRLRLFTLLHYPVLFLINKVPASQSTSASTSTRCLMNAKRKQNAKQ